MSQNKFLYKIFECFQYVVMSFKSPFSVNIRLVTVKKESRKIVHIRKRKLVTLEYNEIEK